MSAPQVVEGVQPCDGGVLSHVWHRPALRHLGSWPALLRAGCPPCGTVPSRRGVDFQTLGGFIILQCSQSAWYFPSLWRLLRVSKLDCDGVNPGESAMLRGLHPLCPMAGGEQCGVGGSPGPNPHPIFTLRIPCSLCAPALAVLSVSCHLIHYTKTPDCL